MMMFWISTKADLRDVVSKMETICCKSEYGGRVRKCEESSVAPRPLTWSTGLMMTRLVGIREILER